MNNKGQIGVGTLLIVFISVIVGVILFTVIAQQIGTTTNTATVSNLSVGTVTNGTTQYLTSYRALSDVVIYNETAGEEILSGNYTITNNVIDPTTGGLSVSILPDTTAEYKSAWWVTGTAQRTDYIADSAGRAIAGIIVIFFALAVAVVALTPALQSKFLEAIGR